MNIGISVKIYIAINISLVSCNTNLKNNLELTFFPWWGDCVPQ